MLRLPFVTLLGVCAAGLLMTSPASAQVKMGVINYQRALTETAELKKAQNDLQAKYKGRADQLEKVQRELQDIQTQLQSSAGKLSAVGQADLEAQGQRKQREAERINDDLQADVQRDRDDLLQRMGTRMSEVVKKLMDEKGLDVIIDTTAAVSFKPTIDITTDAIAAYDKAYPVK
jgi:outer membrane protein